MQWISLGAALALLDAAVTFRNLWPTPAIWWNGAVSIELAVVLLLAVAVSRRRPLRSPAALSALSAIWSLLAIGRYAEVTAPALYGRDINLYWDLQFIPDVVAMVARVAPWLVVLCVVAAVIVLAALFRCFLRAWMRILDALDRPLERRWLAAAAAAVVVLFVPMRAREMFPDDSAFPSAVTLTYARQLRMATLAAATELAPSPPMDSDLARIDGADVFLIFIESYGAISFDRSDLAQGLAPSRRDFDAALRESNRQVVSAFVESPTFGGSSWLAHLSLLSGIDVRDPETNAKLMTQPRDTLVRTFGRRGFRTVALMPGMRRSWPEGAFYGFDAIYGSERLAYQGPQFGWFAIPDQYSLARLDELEVSRPALSGVAGPSRQPLFVVFPTLSTHFPFTPTPPYQPDWPRLLTAAPYGDEESDRAYAREHEMDWINFGPGYVEAMAYDLATIGGYLRARPDHDLVMILIGDHQPPAVLSGARAPWDVPVHIVASRAEVLERFVASGFRRGLTPERRPISKMHELLPIMLDAFGNRPSPHGRGTIVSPEGEQDGFDRFPPQPVHRDHRVDR
jgi:hypothetical protein